MAEHYKIAIGALIGVVVGVILYPAIPAFITDQTDKLTGNGPAAPAGTTPVPTTTGS